MNGTALMSATDWVARLSGDPLEADWLAFETWLASAPGHRGAYDKAMALWLDLDRHAEPLAAAIADLTPQTAMTRSNRRPPLWMGGALMSVAAVAVTFAALNPYRSGPITVYETAKSEHRVVTLADGTVVTLNGGSKIAVQLGRANRRITLSQGEAAFRVTHDAGRPLEVQVGDETLRDIGTEFDVLRANGDITVTVREGQVDVRPLKGHHSVSLTAGSQLQHHEGAELSTVSAVSADDAFAWRKGQLIYRNQRLAQIAADLNRYGDEQIHVDPAAAAVRFSGVLAIDDQQTMVRRLAALLPVAETRQDGVITLHGVDTTK